MENASKALIIAGEILIGMMVIGIISYIILTMGKTAESYDAHISQVEIDKINSYFTKFQDRKDITANEVASAINYAKEQNKTSTVEITIYIYGYGSVSNSFDEVDFIKKNSFTDETAKERVHYSCSCTYDPNTGLVNKVTFTRTN